MACFRCVTPRQCDVWGCVPGTFPSEKRGPDPQPLTPGQQAILDAVPLAGDAPWKLYNPRRQVDATTSTVPTTPPTTLTLAAVEKLLADIPPEPIGEWMREQGFPPEASLLVLPETMRGQLPVWPSYVRFSVDVSSPVLCLDLMKSPLSQGYGQRYRK